MKVNCLNCEHEQEVNVKNVKSDGLGEYAICEKCSSSFDVNLPAEINS